MSTLEKTISLLGGMSEQQIEEVYSYARFLNSQAELEQAKNSDSIDAIFDSIAGVLMDSGKML